MRWVLVKLPSYSATWAAGKKNTSVRMSWLRTWPRVISGLFCQKVAVSVSQLSFTTSHSSLARPLRSTLALSEVAGFWPTQRSPFTRPSFMATNIGRCEWSPMILGCQSYPKSLSVVAAAPYIDLRYETMNFGVLAQYPRGVVSSRSQARSESCFLRAEGAFM